MVLHIYARPPIMDKRVRVYIHIFVRAHTQRESQLAEDNAGNVLIPGYRVFIAVRPSASSGCPYGSFIPPRYQEGHRPPAQWRDTEVTNIRGH